MPAKLKKNYFIAFILLSMLMSACSSKRKTVHYYRLNANANANANTNAPSVENTETSYSTQIRVEISLPEYLQQDAIVTEMDSHEITRANYHRWAEPLQNSVKQQLMQFLNQSSSRVIFSAYNQPSLAPEKMVLQISFSNFQGTNSGMINVSGQYLLYQQQKLLKKNYFEFHDAITGNGYAMVIKALQISLQKLSTQIKNEIKINK